MTLLCKYKNMFGEPGKGAHAARLFGLARNDILATLVGALVVTMYVNVNKTNFWKTFLKVSAALFVLGWVLHLLFCVKTPLTTFLIE